MPLYNEDDSVSKQQERAQAFRDKHKGANLRTLVESMQEVQRRKENLEKDLANVNAEYDVLRFEAIPTKMEEDGVEKVAYEGIGRVSLTADLRVSCLKAQKPHLFAWLRKHKLKDLITEDINTSTLKAWVKDRIKGAKELPPSEIMSVTPITRASITKG